MTLHGRLNILTSACRIVFLTVLAPWFFINAATKIAGHTLSLGSAFGLPPLSVGAYYAYVPFLQKGDGSVPAIAHGYVWGMTFAEFVLPVLFILGLAARYAAAGLIMHMLIGWLVAKPWSAMGALFDATPLDIMPDQFLIWSMLLVPVVLFGAGPVSVDALIGRRKSMVKRS